jgi:hypothetical protein
MNLQNIGMLQELTFIYKYSLNGLKGTIHKIGTAQETFSSIFPCIPITNHCG